MWSAAGMERSSGVPVVEDREFVLVDMSVRSWRKSREMISVGGDDTGNGKTDSSKMTCREVMTRRVSGL
jgi:hypothetical protein